MRQAVWWRPGFAPLVALASACSHTGLSALPDPSVLVPEKVADLPGYTEGIAFDAAGVACVSAGRDPRRPHAVYRLRTGATPERWLDLRIPNGHKMLRDGMHLIAAEGALVRVTGTGRVVDSLTHDAAGLAFRRPNDIALDGHGGFYVTDHHLPQYRTRWGR